MAETHQHIYKILHRERRGISVFASLYCEICGEIKEHEIDLKYKKVRK